MKRNIGKLQCCIHGSDPSLYIISLELTPGRNKYIICMDTRDARERERERDRQTDRQTERERERKKERKRERERDRGRAAQVI